MKSGLEARHIIARAESRMKADCRPGEGREKYRSPVRATHMLLNKRWRRQFAGILPAAPIPIGTHETTQIGAPNLFGPGVWTYLDGKTWFKKTKNP